MSTNIKARCLEYLYMQVSKGNIPQIKKGMVEDLDNFIETIRAEDQSRRIIDRMQLESQAKFLGADKIVEKVAEESKEGSNE